MAQEVRITRRLAATAEDVYDAWTDPDSVMQWMIPIRGARTAAKIEPHVGGRFRIEFLAEGVTYSHEGEYLRLERPTLIEFSWISQATNHQRSVVRIALRPVGRGETELTLVHRDVPAESEQSHRDGWTTGLDRLADLFRSVRQDRP